MRFNTPARRLAGLLVLLWLAGCASHTPLSPAQQARLLPARTLNVPFVAQDEAYCGPAALAMVLAAP